MPLLVSEISGGYLEAPILVVAKSQPAFAQMHARGVALPFLWTFYDAPFKQSFETYFSLLQYYVDIFSLFLREAACLPVYNVGRFDVLLV